MKKLFFSLFFLSVSSLFAQYDTLIVEREYLENMPLDYTISIDESLKVLPIGDDFQPEQLLDLNFSQAPSFYSLETNREDRWYAANLKLWSDMEDDNLIVYTLNGVDHLAFYQNLNGTMQKLDFNCALDHQSSAYAQRIQYQCIAPANQVQEFYLVFQLRQSKLMSVNRYLFFFRNESHLKQLFYRFSKWSLAELTLFLFVGLFNFILFLVVKDRSYLYLMALTVSFLFIFNQHLADVLGGYANYLNILFPMLIAFLWISFHKEFFENQLFPKLIQIFRRGILMLLLLASILLLLFPSFILTQVVVGASAFMVFLAFTFGLTIASKAVRKKIELSRYFLLTSLIPVLIGLLYLANWKFRFFHDIYITDSIMSFAFALKLVLFSGNIGLKVKILQGKNEDALKKQLEMQQSYASKLKVEVELATEEIRSQKEKIEEVHKEITDSINYASRIQKSFMATDELLNAALEKYFVYFNPKESVSGDFYWASQLANGNFAICCADSTGHGVPGAIMSILNISGIENAVENGSTDAAEIFNQARKTIIERLKKDGSEEGGKDGMDASLLIFNKEKNHLSYVGANNPIWLVRNGELIDIKAEKMPVGKHDLDHIPFKGGSISLQKDDLIYAMTDGYQDQFGGEKGKKFKVRPLKDLLITLADKPMEEQGERLSRVFDEWKGNEEQIDDVCILGIRV